MKSNQEAFRERVYNYYLEHRSEGKVFTINHFKTKSIHRSTVQRIIKRAENESGHFRAKGSGRIAKKMTKKNINRLKTMFENNDRISKRQAARKFNCQYQHITKTLNTYTQIKLHKKKKIPNRNASQQKKAKILRGRMYRKYQKLKFIIDDESYFTLSHGRHFKCIFPRKWSRNHQKVYLEEFIK